MMYQQVGRHTETNAKSGGWEWTLVEYTYSAASICWVLDPWTLSQPYSYLKFSNLTLLTQHNQLDILDEIHSATTNIWVQ